MVDIKYAPIKEIVVHEIIKYPIADFIRQKARAGPNQTQAMAVRWVDGIVFVSSPVLPTEQIANSTLEGTVHWGAVEFAEMPDYERTLPHPDTGVILPVIDNSNNTAVSDFVRWLKRQPQWFGTAVPA